MTDAPARQLILLMGPPGSGKGTQARQLCLRFGFLSVATGDLTRELISRAASGDPAAVAAKERYDRGEPQSDEVILEMVRQKLRTVDLAAGLLFDAFPLSVPQAVGLEELRSEFKLKPPLVIVIDVPEAEVVHRLSARRYCPRDQTVDYPGSSTYASGRCPVCQGLMEQRADDQPDVVRHRYAEYKIRLANLISFYEARGPVRHIDGVGTVDAVAEAITRLFSE